jgi:hypothetical protein
MRVFAALVLSALAWGHEWAPSELIATATKSRFALDCSDRLWCLTLYRPILHPDSSTLCASRYDDSVWSEPELVYTGGQACGLGGFDATRARDGRLWILTSAESGIYPCNIAIYNDGAAWSDTFYVGHTTIDVSTYFSLQSDSVGRVWAVFDVGEDFRIWTDVCDDTIWGGAHPIIEYPTGDQVVGSRLTVAPDGTLWAGASALLTPTGDQVFLCRSDSAGSWPDSLIAGPTLLQGCLRDMAADNQGNVWISWADWAEGNILAAYIDTALRWSPHYLLARGTDLGFCNLAVDGENKVWIVYDQGDNFRYRVWNGQDWSPEDSVVRSPASSSFSDAVFYDPVRERIWVSYKTDREQTYVTWTASSGGIEEEEPSSAWRSCASRVVRSVLVYQPTANGPHPSASLVDIAGRKVMDLQPGENDIRHLAPGVYFVRTAESGKRSAVRKVIIQR